MERVKMIWDFRGPNAQQIAEHHKIHLDEFIEIKNLKDTFTATECVSDMYCMAFMIVPSPEVDALRKILHPHRGQRYMEKT